mgnify:CR=1 FL=1
MAHLLMIESWVGASGNLLPPLLRELGHSYTFVTRKASHYQNPMSSEKHAVFRFRLPEHHEKGNRGKPASSLPHGNPARNAERGHRGGRNPEGLGDACARPLRRGAFPARLSHVQRCRPHFGNTWRGNRAAFTVCAGAAVYRSDVRQRNHAN